MSLSLFTTLALAIHCFYEPTAVSSHIRPNAQAVQARHLKIAGASLVSAEPERYASSAAKVFVLKPASGLLDSKATVKANIKTDGVKTAVENELFSTVPTKTSVVPEHVSVERDWFLTERFDELPSSAVEIAREQETTVPEERPLIVDDPDSADLEVGIEAIVPPPFSVEETQAELLQILELDTQVPEPIEPQPQEVPPWAATVYAGRFVTDDLGPALIGNLSGFEDSGVVGFGVARTLAGRRPLTLEAEGQVLQHFGNQGHSEGTIALVLRWHDFPWDDKIDTTFAVGEGLSFATDVPALEIDRNGRSTQLLNYLLFELTFALPQEPDWQLVGRLHHRSGVYGLFDGVGSGSNIYTAGIRRRF